MELGVIGCGKMATALVAGAIKAGIIPAGQVRGFGPRPASREAFAKATGAKVVDSIDGLASCDTLLLSTKPHQAEAALQQLPQGESRLIVSVAAGLSIQWLEEHAPAGSRIVRSMPNTPSCIGEGATGYSLGSTATEADAASAQALLGAVGLALALPESQLDAVTGLSGSGPAYVFLVIEALADGGVRCGLPREQALQLAAQTVYGASKMVIETGSHPAQLKDQVTSPGGTTIAALAELEAAGVRSALIEAVSASAIRSQELGKA